MDASCCPEVLDEPEGKVRSHRTHNSDDVRVLVLKTFLSRKLATFLDFDLASAATRCQAPYCRLVLSTQDCLGPGYGERQVMPLLFVHMRTAQLIGNEF